MSLPNVPEPRPARALRVSRRALGNGLAVSAVRRPGVPLAEVRLRIPAPDTSARLKAAKQLLTASMLGGAGSRDAVAIGERLDALGATLGVGGGIDTISVSGSVLATRLVDLIELIGDVTTAATYPARHVANERDRLAQQLLIRRSQPQAIAGEALRRRLFGRHPYGLPMPTPATMRRIAARGLPVLHASKVKPGGATLVVVGDVSPKRALDAVEAGLARWPSGTSAAPAAPQPPIRRGPIRVVDRPGAVQTNIRIGGHAVARTHPGYAALDLANLVFGGYFASRLSANVREDKGYSYSPHSGLSHLAGGSRFTIGADVATEVTAPALVEIRYELARMTTVAPPADELDKALRYRLGSLVTGTQTQAGLASLLSELSVAGMDAGYLRSLPLELRAVSPGEVLAAAQEHFRPSRLVTVMVGDAARIVAALETVDDVEVVSA